MSGPDIDTDEKNAVGGLDRFVLNIALAAISVFPTLIALIATPWRLAPLLTVQESDGRRGMLLGPGVFFIAAITVTMLVAGWFASPEIIESDTGLIGPAYAKNVSAAVAEGDIWRVISSIGPIYALAVIIGAAASGLRPFVGAQWTLHVSLRASFYQLAASISWIIASSAIIEAVGVLHGAQLSQKLYTINAAPVLVLPIWQYFWFLRRTGDISIVRAMGLSLSIVAMVGAAIFIIGQARLALLG